MYSIGLYNNYTLIFTNVRTNRFLTEGSGMAVKKIWICEETDQRYEALYCDSLL